MKRQTQINGILSPILQKIRIKKALPYMRGNRILDIGCSNGELLQYFPFDIDYIGIEGNNTYFKRAQALHPDHNFINLYLDSNNSASLNIPERDTIFMLAVFEHLNQPREILGNFKKYLSKNGRIIITTPSNYAGNILKIGSKLRLFFSEVDEHKNLFTKEKLISVSKDAGMKIIHYSKFEFGLNHLIVLE